jgi:DNA modification methylase
MKTISILISPEIKAAYFKEFIDCAEVEFKSCLPHLEIERINHGPLHFFKSVMSEEDLKNISKLSFFQGAFEESENGLIPLSTSPEFKLHDNFIFASKFKGKTNERFTQLMLNIGLSTLENKNDIKVLDPMCGRATTLLWAMRYGLNAKGVEIDPRALMDINQIVKKWSKVCEINSHCKEGSVGKKTKTGVGKFLEFHCQQNNLKVITGDSTECTKLLSSEKFDLLISDIPYGVQHRTNGGSKNPLETLDLCLKEWKKCLKPNGSIVIGYNSNNPKRNDFIDTAKKYNLIALSTTLPHRMSESIVRDILILKNAQ